MIGSVLTWFAVPVPTFVHKGLGLDDTSSAEARAPQRGSGSGLQLAKDNSRTDDKKDKTREALSDLTTDDCEGIVSPPPKSMMNKSRPSSRRQSNVAGTTRIPGSDIHETY
jgi:hypothetical protein